MKKIIIDTNAYSNLLRGDDTVLEALGNASIVYMSVIVTGELYSGFKGGNKEAWNKKLLTNFLSKPTVSLIDINHDTSEIFADIKYNLKKAGSPIPINDVWIAAQAFETGSVLITFDEHFKKIPGLRLWDYIKL